MFAGCSNLINLNLSSFDTKNANNMEYMFGGCENLRYID
jgi:surface protein